MGAELLSTADGSPYPGPKIPAHFLENGEVQSARFSPDGKLLVILNTAGQLGVYSIKGGAPRYNLEAKAFDFSSSGRWLVTLRPSLKTETGAVLLEADSGKPLREWPEAERAFFISEERLVIESGGAVRIYDPQTEKSLAAFSGRFAAFTSDGKAAMLSPGQVRVIQVADESLVARMQGDFTNVEQADLKFISGSRWLAGVLRGSYCCGGQGSRFYLWDASNGALVWPNPKDENSMEYLTGDYLILSPDGEDLALAQEETIHILRPLDLASYHMIEGLTGPITALAFLPEGDEVVAATYGGARTPLIFYDVSSGEVTRVIPTRVNAPDYGLAVRSDSRVVSLGNTFWHLPEGQILPGLSARMEKDYPFAAHSATFSPDGHLFAAGMLGGRLSLWDFNAEILVYGQTVCEDIVSSLSFSPDGRRIALACTNGLMGSSASGGNVQIWSASAPGHRLRTLETPDSFGYSMVAYAPDGAILAAAGQNMDLWREGDSQPFLTLYTGRVNSLAFSPDGLVLAAGLQDGTVTLWSAMNGKNLLTLAGDGEYNPVNGLAFSPDGALLAAGMQDGTIRLWGVH